MLVVCRQKLLHELVNYQKLDCRDTYTDNNNLQSAVDRRLIEKYQWETHQLVPRTESEVQEKPSLDWKKINLGFLHEIVKKMFSGVGQNWGTGQF